MRKTKEDYLNNIKKDLDIGNNFVDYFITIGLKEEVIFNDYLYTNDLETLNNSDFVKPDIISKFPPIEKSLVTADENIIRHCFPNGYKLVESTEHPSSQRFYFVLDNNHSSINYPQKYIACLVFYEKIESYQKAYKKYQAYDSNNLNDYSTINNISDNYNTLNDRASTTLFKHNPNKINSENIINAMPDSFDQSVITNNECNSIANSMSAETNPLSMIHSINNTESKNTNYPNINISTSRQKQNLTLNKIITDKSNNNKIFKSNPNQASNANTILETNNTEDSTERRSCCLRNSSLIYNNDYTENSILYTNSKEKEKRDYGSNPLNTSVYSSSGNQKTSLSNKPKKIYAPKCICLVSLYPFCNEMLKILRAIYKFCCNTRLKKPIEKIIENLTIEVPLPPRGFYTVNYQLANETMTFAQTKMNELPYVSIDLEKIFINFKFEQIFEIYKHLLLETRLIFFSKDMALLSPIIHGFITLSYPFKYPYNFITVIPEENFPILDNITPFVFGINEEYDKNFFKKHKLDISQYSFLVIDIDKRGIDLNCPDLSGGRECEQKKILQREFPELPLHYKKKLQEKLKEYINKIKMNSEKETKEKFIWSIRGLFYQFNASIFLNYSKFLNYDYYKNKDMSIPSVPNLFKVEEFIKTAPVEDRPFYRKFIFETQQFADFIYKRMIPKDSKEKLEFLLFDEHITEKNNRKFMSKKVHTYFLQTQMYDFKQVYFVEKHRGLNEKEIEYFKNPENRKNALKYGVEVIFNQKNNNSNNVNNDVNSVKNNCDNMIKSQNNNNNAHSHLNKNGDEVIFNYLFFPALMTEFYFMNNLNNYIIPNNLSQTLEQINIEMVSRSHLSIISMKETEMENYIYLCWAQLWAMTFWYVDPEEKRYRFEQLLSVLDKTKHYEIEIFSLLFESILKHGDESMHFELYQKILSYKLYPTYMISTIHNKTVDKRNSSIKRISMAKTNQDALNRNNISSLSINTFKKNESSFFNEKKSIASFDCTNLLMDCDKTFSNIRKPHTEFRKRTIKSKIDPSTVISDKFSILETFPCVDCQMPLNLNEIGKDFKKMLKDLEWAKCPHCESALLPKLRIKYLDNSENESFELIENNTSNDFDEAEVLYSPFYLKYNFNNSSFIESRLKLDLDTFKMKFNAIFWNSIWYFDIKGLPYDFLMPYYTPPATVEDVCFAAPSLFVQNMRLSYTMDKEANYSKLSFDECEPKFLIDEHMKTNFETNEDSDLIESFRMRSRISTIKFDENRRLSFSAFLKHESTENFIYKALGINKNSSIELKSTSQVLNESFIKYNSKEENEISINNINTNNYKSKIIDQSEIENSNSNNTKEDISESKKTEINRSTNSGFNCSSSNNENEFYLEIDNCNNNFTNENKSNSKRFCLFNSSFDKYSENNNSNFNLNEKAEGTFILESPQRPRKNTVSHKSHNRLKSIFQSSAKGKTINLNDKSQIIIDDNKSENLIDSNLKLKNLNKDNETENLMAEGIKLRSFKSSDDLNKINFSGSVGNFNDAVLKTRINFEDLKDEKEIENDNKEIMWFDSTSSNNILNSNNSGINVRNENENLINLDNLIEGKAPMHRNSINLLNKKEKIKNLKKNENIDNLNNDKNKKVSVALEEKKDTVDKDSNDIEQNASDDTEKLVFETEKALLHSSSKSFYKLKTINEEFESNYGSVNHSDNKNIKTDSNNYLENSENQARKYSTRKNIVKFFEQSEFQDENIKINSEHLISNIGDVNKFMLKKSKSLNNKTSIKNSNKKVSFNENDDNYEIISNIDDLSKTQNLIKLKSEENNVPRFSL